MHLALLAAMRSDLSAPCKQLFAVVYAYTNGTGRADIQEEELLTSMSVTPGTLRRYRANLAAGGWLSSRSRNGVLTAFVVARSTESAHDMRASAPENVHDMRASAPEGAHDMHAFPADEDETCTPCAPEAPPPLSQRGRAGVGAVAKRARDARNVHHAHETCIPCALPAPDGLIDGLITVNPESIKSIHQSPEGGAGGNQPLDPDQQRVVDLLTDPQVGIAPDESTRLARRVDLAYALATVFTWQRLRDAGKVWGVGSLVRRLRESWPADPISPGDLSSPLYERFGSRLSAYVPAGYEDLVMH